MKTIEFEGKKYEVEDWVNWVARDADGGAFGFEEEPYISDIGWVGGVKHICIDIYSYTASKTKV